ncbi:MULTISPECIES: N(2)-fixation sustaining protein CowN [Rhodopseudomonas]|uniref:N(2)-fixation sustaining protein CowN n=1 Tax=Rhodopseudomonas TaxID=1073 RepID=UPI0005C91CA4|nr:MULTISPECIES: N(2)-fixation sustaining protein CowN [Rhodopseudomonas]MDF3811836.1 N(2)-fixation sustaining protein CowN [Rhodopseudomonas sp. BAL398]WOK20302.1 N(2)-fixation sustaining protein CowN [Rhodopseudomonas sp. BAL398]
MTSPLDPEASTTSDDKPFDRYVSFKNADWEAKSQRVIDRLQLHIDRDDNPFWAYFSRQRELAHQRGMDDLRVLHNFLPTIRELLDDLDDSETLALLEDLEVTCM